MTLRWKLAGALVPSLLLFCSSALAQWTSLPLPESLQGASIQTTGEVNARCHSITSGQACADSTLTPSFNVSQSAAEVLQTLPAGQTLKILEAQRDPDGFALRVQDAAGSIFWIFESSTTSSAALDGKSLNHILNDITVATAAAAVQTTVANTNPASNAGACCDTAQVASTDVPQIPDFNSETDSGEGFYSLCNSFINESGGYGANGQILIEGLREDHRKGLYNNEFVSRLGAMSSLCPNFSTFTNDQKERFWVWTFMAIAHVESKCGKYNKGAVAGPYGHYPWGILQMELQGQGMDGARSQWAENPNKENACDSTDVAETSANLNCGLDTMLTYLAGYYTCSKQEYPGQAPVLTDPESCSVPLGGIYWQKMRTLNGDISRRIKTFAACGAQ